VARRVKRLRLDHGYEAEVGGGRFGVEGAHAAAKGQGYDHALLELLLVLERPVRAGHSEITIEAGLICLELGGTDQGKTAGLKPRQDRRLGRRSFAQVSRGNQDAISIAQQRSAIPAGTGTTARGK
jgi:hypothetical protein